MELKMYILQTVYLSKDKSRKVSLTPEICEKREFLILDANVLLLGEGVHNLVEDFDLRT